VTETYKDMLTKSIYKSANTLTSILQTTASTATASIPASVVTKSTIPIMQQNLSCPRVINPTSTSLKAAWTMTTYAAALKKPYLKATQLKTSTAPVTAVALV
jgi:hypothetical protein